MVQYYWMNRLESIVSSDISAKSEVRRSIAHTDTVEKERSRSSFQWQLDRYSTHLDDRHQTKCWSGARVFFFSGEQVVRQESCRPRIDHPGGWRLLKDKMEFTGSLYSSLLQSIDIMTVIVESFQLVRDIGVEPRVLMKIHRFEVDPQPGYDLSCVSFYMYCFINSCMPARAPRSGKYGTIMLDFQHSCLLSLFKITLLFMILERSGAAWSEAAFCSDSLWFRWFVSDSNL